MNLRAKKSFLGGGCRPREPECQPVADKAAQYHRQKQRVVVLTENTAVEGTIYFPEGVRLSDALNSPAGVNQRYLPLADVRVVSLVDGREILRSGFILMHHHFILGIVPASELHCCCAFGPDNGENRATTTSPDPA